MTWDFKRFPELTNAAMDFYYWNSPHKQITEDFIATVKKVHDGDTITLKWEERDFEFPLRLAIIGAPELNEEGGKESQITLENMIIGKEVNIVINQENRVEKWGRLLGEVFLDGININEEMMNRGQAVLFETRNENKFLPIDKLLSTGGNTGWS